jgi:hypothetical protein
VSETRSLRRAGLALLLALPLCVSAAAPAGWESFTAAAWKSWTSPAAPPSAVVFTTTDCEHCPAVIEQLRQQIATMPAPRPALRVVVTDAGNLTPLAAGARWYALADTRHVFEGNELAVRYAVSPRWRGETPLVALLAPRAAAQLVVGHPAAAAVEAWGKSALSAR